MVLRIFVVETIVLYTAFPVLLCKNYYVDYVTSNLVIHILYFSFSFSEVLFESAV